MFRQGATYGPYVLEQLRQMEDNHQLFYFDLFCSEGDSRWISFAQARPAWQIRSKKSRNGHRRPRRALAAILIILLIAGSLAAAFYRPRDDERLRIGKSEKLAQATLDVSGGQIVVDEPGNELDGLTLTVPVGAFSEDERFTVTASPIVEHAFGDDVHPVGSLISIDNGHDFSAEPMLLTIPIQIAADEFAMGFFYDRKTGDLEGIPLAQLTQDSMTLMTCHFSNILILATNLANLLNLDVDSGFRPGVDDWQFVNRGSIIAPGGHCAGQSVTAMFYYTEIFRGRGQARLFGRFDNNNYERRTADFWEDDSWSYRFASTVQKTMAWESASSRFLLEYDQIDDAFSMASFTFAMKMTGDPQLVFIYSKAVGHAIIAYRIENGQLFVADPNYPGKANLRISYSSLGGFSTYSSGANASEIEKYGMVIFDEIRYMAQSALINYNQLNQQYDLMLKGEVGANLFPGSQIEYLKSVDQATKAETWAALDANLVLDSGDTEKAGAYLRNKVKLRFKNLGNSKQQVTICTGLAPVIQKTFFDNIQTGSYQYYTIDLVPGVEHYAFIMEQEGPGSNYVFNDTIRCRIIFDQQADLKFDKLSYTAINQMKTTFKAEVKDAPADPIYRWDFGDGRGAVETDKPKVTYTYQDSGDFTLKVSLIDRKTNQEVASTDAGVESLDLFGQWQLNYTIEESEKADKLLTRINQAINRYIDRLLGIEPDETDDAEISLRGVNVACILNIDPPASDQPGEPIQVQLQQLSSSSDNFDPNESLWTGTLTVVDDQIQFKVAIEDELMAFTFKGKVTRNSLFGKFDAVWISGSYQAVR